MTYRLLGPSAGIRPTPFPSGDPVNRRETHQRELYRLLAFVGGFGVFSAATYLIPGTEAVRPWVEGEPVPLVHLLVGDSLVVETHPGVLVARDGQAAPSGGHSLATALGDTGLFEEETGEALPVEPLAASPPPVDSHALADEAAEADPGLLSGEPEEPEEEEPAPAPSLPASVSDEPAGLAQAPTAEAAALPASDEPAGPAPDAPSAETGLDAVASLDLDLPASPASDSGAADSGRADTGRPEDAASPPLQRRDPRLRDRVPARGTPLEVPAGALDAWFSALARAEAGEEGHLARALHFGDSTIAGDGITRTVRRRLQSRFGDGGPGFLAVQVDPRWASRPGLIRKADGDWKTLTITFGGAEMAYYGLAGTVSTAQGEATSYLQGPKRGDGRQQLHRFDLFFQVQPDGGSFYAGTPAGKGTGASTASAARGDAFRELLVPEGTDALRVTTSGDGPVTLYGVAMETAGPGVTWETLGVAGAGDGSMYRQGRNHLKRQVGRRDPALLVYQMGGNELGLPILKSGDGSKYKERYKKSVQRVLAGAPQASCLLITPLDQAVRSRGTIQSKETLTRMISLQREVARELGCAFWDARGAMGGDGAFSSWLNHDPPLAWSDLYHLTGTGLAIVGHTLTDALELAYDDWRRAGGQAAVASSPGPAGG